LYPKNDWADSTIVLSCGLASKDYAVFTHSRADYRDPCNSEAKLPNPHFVAPRFDTVVEPLRASRAGFDRGSVNAGDVSREVWRTNWPDAVPKNSYLDLGTLQD
jgi:hypothetical protein